MKHIKFSRTLKRLGIFILASVFMFSFISLAQDKGAIIKEVRIKDNRAISEATITSKIKTKPGDVFSQDILNDDLKRLYALGYFTDASIDVERKEDGVIVTIIVEEKPVVEKVVFTGNKKISTRRLEKVTQIKTGEMLNYAKLSQDVQSLKALYGEQGFQHVSIDYRIDTDKDTNTAIVYIFIEEKVRIRIKKIYVEGNKNVSTKTILKMMGTRPAWFFSRGYFKDEAFEADMEKIKRYYQSLGYLDVTITADFKYDEDTKLMFITLKINEGKRYITGDIAVQGNLVFSKKEISEKITMKNGDPFSHRRLRLDMDNIREFYYHKGYMNVEVDIDREIDHATNMINLIYTIDAHNVVNVGKIDIAGNTKTKDIVIRRELRIYPGDRFDGDKIKRSKERLYNLGFFEDIYFGTKPTNNPDVKDLVINVKETKTGEFAFGGGYSSIDEFLGFVQVTQKNFDILNVPNFTGDGQHLAVKAQVGSVRRDYELSWTEPWIFDYPLSFGFDLYNRTHSRRSAVGYGYKEVRTGGDLRLGKELTEYIRTDLMYKLEEVNISDLSEDSTQDLIDERGENWISALSLGVTYDTRDNIYNPKKGMLHRIILENAGGFLGFDKDYIKGFLLASYYQTLFKKLVLELKTRGGLASSYGDTENVPIYERFYAGGANTIRGYKERRVGPRDPGSNDPIGGNATIIGNAELTFPIYEKIIKGAVFYDVGNVWRRTSDLYKLESGFKQGAGAGVRVKTPIGPVKLDVGYPLSDNHNDKKQLEWYFSVSHGF